MVEEDISALGKEVSAGAAENPQKSGEAEREFRTGTVQKGRAFKELAEAVVEAYEASIHALILNIARRQLGPVAEGIAIKKLVEARREERGSTAAVDPQKAGTPGGT